MTGPARLVFAVLVAATFGAFFVAQRLKHAPTALQDVRGRRVFSPNGDGRKDLLRVRFELKDADDIAVDVIDEAGDAVRSLVAGRRVPAQTPVRMRWNGRDDAGRRAPDGRYRLRVTLRDEGRTVVVRRTYRLDTVPPRPLVTAIGPGAGPGPALFPNAAGLLRIETTPTGRHPAVALYRTAGGPHRLVTRRALRDRAATWDGTAEGRRVPDGTYVAVARWRDRAGNEGTSVPLDPKSGLPAIGYGERWPGRGGIAVRHLALQPPSEPVRGGAVATIGVDARGRRYRWALRRLGTAKPVRSGVAVHSPFHIHAPAGRSGVYLFEVASGRRRAAAPVPVRAVAHRPVLVVLPVMTWQGRNPVDDDGDGATNVLDRGVSARVDRVYAGGALPAGFTEAEGPLLSFLDHHGLRYELTTDVALAAGRGPQLKGHHGVVLPGDARWLPLELQRSLRRFVRDGGTLLLTGLDSLRRDVGLSAERAMSRPTPAAPTNLFGSRLRPVVHEPVTVTNLNDRIALFSGEVFGGTGVFGGFAGYEPTAALGPDEQLAANAVTPDGETVIVAARFGKGLEIRTGLLGFATRLGDDPNTAQLLLRCWTLLSHR